MRNRRSGVCYRCGGLVPPGAGHFERVTEDQRRKWPGAILPEWLVQHADCARRWRGTDQHYIHKDQRDA